MPARNTSFRTIRFHSSALRLSALAGLSFAILSCSETPTEPEVSPSAGLAPSAGDARRFVPGRVLVRVRTGADESSVAHAHGGALRGTLAQRIRLLEVKPGREVAVARSLARRADVEFAEPDWLRTLDDPTCPGCALPNDPLFGYKWDLHNDGAVRSSAGDVLAMTGASGALPETKK